MRILGLEITRTKSSVPIPSTPRSWYWPTVREPFTGAWQKNMEIRTESVLTYSAVYACVTLIAGDVAKLRLRLTQNTSDQIWEETDAPAFSPVLKVPNRFQNRVKFIEQWVTSKLLHGNAYILKERDGRGVVNAMYVLDPCVVFPSVTSDGDIFYQIGADNLAGTSGMTVPASEIIHDVMIPLFHPLCGVSPLTACGLAALQGLTIQGQSTKFFGAGMPSGGILLVPTEIPDAQLTAIKQRWEDNRASGSGVAVLSGGMKFERMSINAIDAQLIDQLRWTAEQVCTAFHISPFQVGIGPMPTYNNVEQLTQMYYGSCLQILLEALEACLDAGLALPPQYRTSFDLADLLMMDQATKTKAVTDGIKGGIYTPNEGRALFNLPPLTGGDDILMQQQMWPMGVLAERDPAALMPQAPAAPAPATDGGTSDGNQRQDQQRQLARELVTRARAIAGAPA